MTVVREGAQFTEQGTGELGYDFEAIRAEAAALFSEVVERAGSEDLPIVWAKEGTMVYDGHGHEYLIGQDSDYLSCNPSIVLVNPELASQDSTNPETFSGFDFEEMPGSRIGAANSVHGVFFGEVQFKQEGQTDPVSLKVAIKPYMTRPSKAFRERRMLQALAEHEFFTFNPVGVVVYEGKTFLITQYDPSVISLDNIGWRADPGSPVYEDEVAPYLSATAAGLGIMHSRGFFHGDAQIKNLGMSADGTLKIFDLESTKHFPAEAMLDHFHTASHHGYGYWEFRNLWASLVHTNEFLRFETPEFRQEEFDRLIWEPYRESLLKETGSWSQGNRRQLESQLPGLHQDLQEMVLAFDPNKPHTITSDPAP